MKDKKKIIEFIIVVLLVIIIISLIVFNMLSETKVESVDDTPKTTATIDKTFKGYQAEELDYDKIITYDYQSRYEFIYGDTQSKEIFIQKNSTTLYCYTVALEDGVLVFKESLYSSSLNGYESTNNVYEFTDNTNITSFAIGYENDQLAYTILALDKDSNVYMYEANGKDTIVTLISKLKKQKTISKASKVGFYTMSNDPYKESSTYEAIYVDESNNIRYLDSKSSLFFDSAFYCYIGSDNYDQLIYVLKDGLMKYASNTNNRYLNTGDINIYYRGSFYEIDEDDMKENIYIISMDGYLYAIEDVNSKSSAIIEKVSEYRIKKIGYQYIRGTDGYALDERNILIQFEDDSTLKYDSVLGYELLN